MDNQSIADLLRKVAAAYSIENEQKFRFQIIAYQKAAESVENTPTPVMDLLKKGSDIPGIGSSIKQHLTELDEKGESEHFNKILQKVPEALYALLDIPTFGPKKAYKLVTEFHLKDPNTVIDDIKKLAEKGRIAELEGFGQKSEADIIQAIEEFRLGKSKSNRMVLPFAESLSKEILRYLTEHPDVIEAFPLGSLRRKKSTIGDVDIAVSSKNPQQVIEYFVKYPHKDRVIEQGEITSSIIVSGNKQIDLMVLKPEQLGSLLQHFTGSKNHNIALRELAIKKGMSLSEKGIKEDSKLYEFSDEKSFYAHLGLAYIEPEIRENTGEIEAAQSGKLPELVRLEDILGDLHVHSNYDTVPSHDFGKNTMQEHIDMALRLKYKYIGFSEHNPRISNMSKSQINEVMKTRFEYIEQIKESNKNIRIFNLLEVDILASGDIALPESSMQYVDAILVSIHSSFTMKRSEITKRIITGLSHPKARIFAHPTSRLINQRKECDIDWEKLFEFAYKNNKALEINAWPTRLDLPDTLVKQAKEAGIKFVIDTDSHAVNQMENMKYGVYVARRGWCEKEHILNTYGADHIYDWILDKKHY